MLEDPLIEPDTAPRGDRLRRGGAAVAGHDGGGADPAGGAEQALRIFYFEDKTHSTIAEELGLPLGTVKSRLQAGARQAPH